MTGMVAMPVVSGAGVAMITTPLPPLGVGACIACVGEGTFAGVGICGAAA